MATKNGGYAIVKYNDSDIFAKVKNAYENEKPILFYDDDKTCFYVDSVKLNGDGDYEFTKGGKTWTVTDNNTLSSEGSLQNHLYNYLFYLTDNNEANYYLSYISSQLVNNVEDLFELLNNKNNSGFIMNTSGDTNISCGFSGDIDGFDILSDFNDIVGSVGGTFSMENYDFSTIKIIKLF